jgi:hypothetical protein
VSWLGVAAGSVASTFAPRAHQGAAETPSSRALSGEWRVHAAAPSEYAAMDLAVSVRDGSRLSNERGFVELERMR